MIQNLNPLHLIPEYQVTVNYLDTIPDVARVGKNSDKSYVIEINKKKAGEMFARSLLLGKVPFEYFLAALLYHEIAHIKYKSFSVDEPILTAFYHYVVNVLLDAQIEYQLSKDHPEAAKYLRYSLICLRRDCNMSLLKSLEGGNETIKRRDTFFRLVRFGTIIKDADQDFVNFLLPLVLSVQRNDSVENVYEAATAVYEYMYDAAENKEVKQALENLVTSGDRVPMTDDDVQDIESAAGGQSDDSKVLVSNIKDLLDELKDQSLQAIHIGKQAGTSGPDIELEEKSDAFYRKTINEYHSSIAFIRNAFKRKVNEVVKIAAFDGELDVRNQQQAYIDSFLGEESQIYIIQQLKKISLDHILIRDVSLSTSSFKEEYAKACIILHAAIQGLGIRDAHIDFSTSHIKLLDFDEQLKFARIHPRATGGTAILSSYQEALKMRWKGKKKLITVVTDGYITRGYEATEQQLKKKGILIKKYHIGTDGSKDQPDLIQTSIERFHFDIAKDILREL